MIGLYLDGFFDYGIADEVHELKGETAQGAALGTMASACDRTVILTGTLLGGYEYPAAFSVQFRNVLAVGGTLGNPTGVDPVYCSNYGDWVAIAAPGYNIVSNGIPASGPSAPSVGTSFAAPFVSGTAALIRSVNPTWSSSQIVAQMEQTTSAASAPVSPPTFGRVSPVQQVIVQVSGSGTVTISFSDGLSAANPTASGPPSTPTTGPIVCSSSAPCSHLFVGTSKINLTAAGGTVTWGGDCVSFGTSVNITVPLAAVPPHDTADKNCTATFNLGCPDGTVCGKVTNHRDGSPIGGLRLSMQNQTTGSFTTVTTASTGMYSLAVQGTGPFFIQPLVSYPVLATPVQVFGIRPGGASADFQISYPPAVTVTLPSGYDRFGSQADLYSQSQLPQSCGPGVGIICPFVQSFNGNVSTTFNTWVSSYWLTCFLQDSVPPFQFHKTTTVQLPALAEGQVLSVPCPPLP